MDVMYIEDLKNVVQSLFNLPIHCDTAKLLVNSCVKDKEISSATEPTSTIILKASYSRVLLDRRVEIWPVLR